MADQTTPTPEPAPEAEEPILEFGDAEPSIPTPKPVALEVTPEASAATPAAPAQIDDSILSESEKKQVEEFVDKIDLSQSGAIMQYGVGTQKKMADFSDKTLDSVRTKDLGEMGQEITGLIAQLKGFDPTAEQPKGLMGFFRKQSNKIQELNARYT